jgi:hypothetical protein
MYIPIINYVPSAQSSGDIKSSGLGLFALSMAYFTFERGAIRKIAYLLIMAMSCWGMLLSGGRVATATLFLLPLFWSIVTRRFLALALSVFVGLSLFAIVNTEPDFLDSLPPLAQRSLSTLLIEREQSHMDEGLSLSDEWHRRLQEAGRDRWLSNGFTAIFGNGIRPYDESFWDTTTGGEIKFENMLDIATRTGNYESSLWQILAVLGATGLVLYLNVMWFLIPDAVRNLWRHGICDPTHALYFLATFFLFVWILFCPKAGTFPSYELMLALFARTAHEDQIRKNKAEAKKQAALSAETTPA